jgi:CheY-like chemotaxis protein
MLGSSCTHTAANSRKIAVHFVKEYASVPDNARADILLVEDDQALAEMYRIKLSAEGHRVEIAADGPSGLRAALGRPRLLLLDIRLPGFDGLELLARLREEPGGAELPVIVLSNFDEADTIERGAELGALAHLVKSQTTPASLAETIRSLLPVLTAEPTGT